MAQSVSCSKGHHDACLSRRCGCMCGHPGREFLADQEPADTRPPAAAPVEVRLELVALDRLTLAPNVRRDITAVDELAESIRRFGILEPIIGCPHAKDPNLIEVIAGQRRLTAARVARIAEAPVVIRPRPMLKERVLLQLAENLERADMTPIEEATAFAQLADTGMTQVLIALAVSRSDFFVSTRLQLLDLPPLVREAVHARTITPTVALSVPRAFFADPEALARLAEALAGADGGGGGNATLRSWAHEESRRAHAAGQTVTAKYALERPVSLPVEYLELAKEAAGLAGKSTREWIRDAITDKARKAGFTLPDHVAATKRTARPARSTL